MKWTLRWEDKKPTRERETFLNQLRIVSAEMEADLAEAFSASVQQLDYFTNVLGMDLVSEQEMDDLLSHHVLPNYDTTSSVEPFAGLHQPECAAGTISIFTILFLDRC